MTLTRLAGAFCSEVFSRNDSFRMEGDHYPCAERIAKGGDAQILSSRLRAMTMINVPSESKTGEESRSWRQDESNGSAM